MRHPRHLDPAYAGFTIGGLPWGTRAYVRTRRHFFQKSFFTLEYSTYICSVNQLNKYKMEKTINLVARVWIGVLMSMTFVSLAYALVQVVTGNVHSTASFEF